MSPSMFDQGLMPGPDNHEALTPLSFLDRTADVFPDRVAVVHGDMRQTWFETHTRCRRLASTLVRRGMMPLDAVGCAGSEHAGQAGGAFRRSLAGAVINAINVRLDADAVSFILPRAAPATPSSSSSRPSRPAG